VSELPSKEEVTNLLKDRRAASENDDKPGAGEPRQSDPPTAAAASKEQDKDRKLQLKLARISLLKTLATLFFGSALAVILAHIIQQQQVDIEKAKNYQQVQQSEQENLQRYFKYTMDGDLYDRLKLAEFFKNILTGEEDRERWTKYYEDLERQWKRYTEVSLRLAELDKNPNAHAGREYAELAEEKAKLAALIDPVKVEIADLSGALPAPSQAQATPELAGAKPADEAKFWPLKGVEADASFTVGPLRFGASRGGGRLHSGVDLKAPMGTPVVAPEAGRIERDPYYFYSGTYALELTTGRGPVFRFGQLDKQFPNGVKEGAEVEAGDVIGYVGRLQSGSSNLHMEMYAGTADGRLTVAGTPFRRRGDLVDPTPYLLDLRDRVGGRSQPDSAEITNADAGSADVSKSEVTAGEESAGD
jgi:murein DD-endopeptidase MepM/ murein hydrolase activator NlpD